MKRILLILLLTISGHASAVLLCANDDDATHATWYVGQPYPFSGLETVGDVWCEATGVELSYVQQHFSGIRMHSGKGTQGADVVLWEGEDAAFIIENL